MTDQIRIVSIKERVSKHWGERAAEFDKQGSHGLLTVEQVAAWRGVLQRLAPPPPLRILDVGCGTGFLALQFAAMSHHATGVDIAPEMLEQARRKATADSLTVTFLEGDAEEPAFPEESFDLVTARHLIWTLPRPEVAVHNWLRVLVPGGRVALVEGHFNDDIQDIRPAYQDIYDQLPLYRGSPSAEMTEFLKSCGVAQLEVYPLMNAVLWGSEPETERYLIVGTKTGGSRV